MATRIRWAAGSTLAFVVPALACLVGLGACDSRQAPVAASDAASLVLKNGRFHTVDPARPWATSVAIRDGRLVAVGSDADTERLTGKQTRVIDLRGRLVLPAFHDVHSHPVLGVWRTQCAIEAGKTPAEYQQLIAKCLADQPGTGWLVGWGWEPGLFTPKGMPPKELLDAIAPDRPVAILSMGAHDLWVNSRALQLAGITRATADPPNGTIDRDPKTGEPTGGLHEEAMAAVDKLRPPSSPQALENALYQANRHFNSVGIVGWQDASVSIRSDDEFRVLETYSTLRRKNALKGHITLALLWDADRGIEQVPDLAAASERLHAIGLEARTIKIFLDGALGGRTAALLEPYSDRPGFRGDLHVPAEALNEAVTQLDGRGFQVHIHAIGDRAVRVALDSFAAARARNGKKDNRHLIAHAELIAREDQSRFADLDVVLAPEPRWAHGGPFTRMVAERVGPGRMDRVFLIGGPMRAGAKVAFSSDWPVASANPLESIEVAVTRRDAIAADAEAFLADDRITLEQAVAAYTLQAAYVSRKEAATGSIEVGKSADLVVLDRDVFKIPAEQISDAKVILTLLAGEAVHGEIASLAAADPAT